MGGAGRSQGERVRGVRPWRNRKHLARALRHSPPPHSNSHFTSSPRLGLTKKMMEISAVMDLAASLALIRRIRYPYYYCLASDAWVRRRRPCYPLLPTPCQLCCIPKSPTGGPSRIRHVFFPSATAELAEVPSRTRCGPESQPHRLTHGIPYIAVQPLCCSIAFAH